DDPVLHAPGSDPRRRAERRRLRGLPPHRRVVGPPAPLPLVRPRRLLRLVAQPARDRARADERSSDHRVDRARRELALVLRRRGAGL
ncbi:MAG: Isopeptidase T, partial [uncultured Thermoleophilia bacterium]